MQVVLISGLSGSGKSIALNVLEDAGYYCIDNLPAPLLFELVTYLRGEGQERLAVAIDMRGGASIAALPPQLRKLEAAGIAPRIVFLDARDEVLIRRFSETRRRHPLAGEDVTLAEAIQREREALEMLSTLGHRIDTSYLPPNSLRHFVRDFVLHGVSSQLTLLFESFGFKLGIPLDADLVFDVRCLPNPHYEPTLRPLTGRDPAVIAYLAAEAEVRRMEDEIAGFLERWLPSYARDNRAYLTVAIGCTGGQHRSVYLAEQLAARFKGQAAVANGVNVAAAPDVLIRHRNIAL